MGFFSVVVFLLLIFFSSFWDIKASVSMMGKSWMFPLWEGLLCVFLAICTIKVCKIIYNRVLSFLGIKTNVRKGVNYLQKAFSGLLIKDVKEGFKSLSKARKHLGDIPIISWMEGQLYLISGDGYKAKSAFFNLSSKEKDTVFGAYSLAQLSLQDRSDKESVEAIKAILKVYPDSREFINQIISLSIKEGSLDDAFHYLKKLSKDNRMKDIEAIIYFEKWKRDGDLSNLKKANKLAPAIANIAIAYTEELIKQDDIKYAKKILLKSFEKFPSVDILKKYIFLEEDKIKAGGKLLKIASQSWIPNYYLATICREHGMDALAFEYIVRAFEIAPYHFIAEVLVDINSRLDQGEKIIDLSKSKEVKFYWRCQICGDHSDKWKPICSCCMSVASYQYVEEVVDNVPMVI